jgi:hypothetical protein
VPGIFPKFGGSATATRRIGGLSRIVRFLAGLLTLLALAGVAGLGALGVMRARDDAFAREIAEVRARAHTVASVVHDAVQGNETAIAGTASREPFQRSVAASDWGKAGPFVLELITARPGFSTVAIYDRFGRLAVRIPFDRSVANRRFGQQEYFSQARNAATPHISNLFVQLGLPKVAVVAYSMRIRLRASTYGVLVGTTPITEFDTLIAPYASSDSTVRIYDAGGERVSPSSEASGKTYTTDAVVGPTLAGRSIVRRSNGSIVAAEPVADYGWAVVVSQQARRGDKTVHDLTVRLSLLAGGATFLALIAAATAWRRKSPHAD